jgi:hypothetical protein
LASSATFSAVLRLPPPACMVSTTPSSSPVMQM